MITSVVLQELRITSVVLQELTITSVSVAGSYDNKCECCRNLR